MLTAHEAYQSAHVWLFSCSTQPELFQTSKTIVENYLENRRIWDELNFYKINGSLLGKHPIFESLQRNEFIRGLKTGELVQLKIRLENNLVRNRSALKRDPHSKEAAARIERIEKMETELLEVNRLLNI